ncbi:MAG: phosphatidylinositol-specific phospholipase C domain-containing protein [Treponemataceae bacterium]|nr:phosphatidylinositol-specific phospholipase C domain-containing protein [Treponemataceae bacterium]
MANKEKSKRGKIGDLIFDIIVCAILVFLFVIFITPRFMGNKKSYGTYEGALASKTWMAELPDTTMMQMINLPGTHDSATQYVKFAWFSKCQTRSIKTQLEEGYRYLDIRLAIDDKKDALKFMHGFANCKTGHRRTAPLLYLDSVLEDIYAFLQENPSESIVFVAKKDHGDHTTAEFQQKLNEYIQKNPEFWFTENRIPKLGEVRGKILLARRYDNEANLENAGLNLVWNEQGNHDIAPVSYELNAQKNGLNLYVEDRYKYDTKDKWIAFQQALENSTKENIVNALYVSFLSTNGNTKFGHPIKYAIPLNKLFWKTELEKGKRYGWLILDYATEELAQKIYMTNF